MGRKKRIITGICAHCGEPLTQENEDHDCLFASTTEQLITNKRQWVNKVQDVAKELRRALKKRDSLKRPFNDLSQQSRTAWHGKAKRFIKALKYKGYNLVTEEQT